MEDKIIIKSERYNVKKIFKYALIVGVIGLVFLFIFIDTDIISRRSEWYDYNAECVEAYENRETDSLYDKEDYYDDKEWLERNGPKFIYVINELIDYDFSILLQIIICFGGPEIIAGIIYLWLKSYELTITDKRAYGFAAFGKRVDLPVDSITAIGLGWLKSIKITTASGRISFLLIKNRDEMYETISKLIVERQNKETKTETVVKQETSNADEIKKYKDLLDSGVITQEEFDAKKKQLLGL